MLRHEASATDETDASCLSMTVFNKKEHLFPNAPLKSI